VFEIKNQTRKEGGGGEDRKRRLKKKKEEEDQIEMDRKIKNKRQTTTTVRGRLRGSTRTKRARRKEGIAAQEAGRSMQAAP
jgi:hypothetical protein